MFDDGLFTELKMNVVYSQFGKLQKVKDLTNPKINENDEKKNDEK